MMGHKSLSLPVERAVIITPKSVEFSTAANYTTHLTLVEDYLM